MFTSMEEMFLPCPQRMTSVDKRWKPIPSTERAPNCPRCESSNTKFCYYNNYSLTQPRYFCKSCRRYWTRGGSLRNVPVGGGYRKNRRGKSSKVSSTNERVGLQNSNYSEFESSSSTDPHGNFCKFGKKSLSRSSDTTTSDGFTTDLSVLCAKFLNQAPEVSPCSPSESDANYDLKMECFDQKKTYLEMEDFNLDSNSKIGQVGFVQEFDKNAKEQETNVDSSFDHSFYMPQDMFLSNWNPTTRFFSNFSWHCPVTEFEQWTPPGQLDEDLHPGIPNSSLCSFDLPSFEYLSSP